MIGYSGILDEQRTDGKRLFIQDRIFECELLRRNYIRQGKTGEMIQIDGQVLDAPELTVGSALKINDRYYEIVSPEYGDVGNNNYDVKELQNVEEI